MKKLAQSTGIIVFIVFTLILYVPMAQSSDPGPTPPPIYLPFFARQFPEPTPEPTPVLTPRPPINPTPPAGVPEFFRAEPVLPYAPDVGPGWSQRTRAPDEFWETYYPGEYAKAGASFVNPGNPNSGEPPSDRPYLLLYFLVVHTDVQAARDSMQTTRDSMVNYPCIRPISVPLPAIGHDSIASIDTIGGPEGECGPVEVYGATYSWRVRIANVTINTALRGYNDDEPARVPDLIRYTMLIEQRLRDKLRYN